MGRCLRKVLSRVRDSGLTFAVEACNSGSNTHAGRIFEIRVERNSELPLIFRPPRSGLRGAPGEPSQGRKLGCRSVSRARLCARHL